MTIKQLFAKDMPVIILAFILAFSLPHAVTPETISEHVTGIALGFGFAWLLKLMIDWAKLNKKTQTEGSKNEA
ncbi:hypothetical protein [Thiomicrorhabdus aquaedulcis]|uniref:hypothetical protein n=1 Tax=Thiomicrorhabdus aquaedulcis TaxID=2211106 RepID=UPI000FD8EDD7|nr:hypothetical protein [Thiomicrorhabdus aquaedulcis]